MLRFKLIRPVRLNRFPNGMLILDPLAVRSISREDYEVILNGGLCVIDCSWNHIEDCVKDFSRFKGIHRCLPFLLAANPLHYGQPTKLSSIEALAAALYIIGFEDHAQKILDLFKWGPQFLNLNEELLNAYRDARTSKEIIQIQQEFIEL